MIIKKLTKTTVVAALSMAIVACGGGGGGGGAASSTISGTGMKGVLKDADVSLYAIENGVLSGTALATARTTADGKYSFSGVNYRGPVLVQIKGNTTATMVCDIAPDCGGTPVIAFGADAPFDSSNILEAVSVLSGSSISINVTPLTYLAAQKAKSAGFSESAIKLANSHIANLFGLTGDVSSLPVADVTGSSTDASAQKTALLGAAVYAAARADGKTLDQLISEIVNANGQLSYSESTSTSSSATTLAEIYEQAANIAGQANLSASIMSAIAAARADAENQPDQETTAQASDTALLSQIEKGKAFITQIRTLGSTFVTEDSAETFKDEVDAAKTLLSSDTENAAKVLAYVGDAVSLVHEKLKNGEQLTNPYAVSIGGGSVPVGHTTSGNKTTYTVTNVTGFVGNPVVNITAALDGTFSETSNESSHEASGSESINATLTASGSVTQGNAKLEVLPGSKIKGNLTLSYKEKSTNCALGNWCEDPHTYTYEDHFSSPSIELDLHVKLSGVGEHSAKVITGKLKSTITNFKSDSTENNNYSSTGFSFVDTTVDTIGTASLDFSGEVQTAANKSLKVSFNFTANGNGVKQTTTETWGWNNENYESVYDYNKTLNETANKYANGSFTLIMDASLTGNATDKGTLTLTGSRTGLDTGKVEATLKYAGGKSLVISAPVVAQNTNPTITIKNQDGVVATIKKNANDKVEGSIKVGNDQIATISHPSNILVRFGNGDIESVE